MTPAPATTRQPHPDSNVQTIARPSEGETPERSVTKAAATRLSVNLGSEVATALRRLLDRNQLSITDGIRRAITVWSIIDDALRAGERVEIVDPRTNRVRELHIVQ